MTISYSEAKSKILNGDFSVENFLKQEDHLLEYGYCLLLKGKCEEAAKIFGKIARIDFRADWGVKIIQFIQGYVKDVPSYFQIRNFLEIDLNLLIQAGQAQYVENIINGGDLLYSVNPESYKFIARVMLNNDFVDLALYFLDKAKERFYNDPEMHLMLANCYLKKGNKCEAEKSAKACLELLPEYFPAKNFLNKIN